MNARIIWIGPSTLDGAPIALLAKIGGNGKVNNGGGQVIGFAVVSLALVEQVLADEHKDTPGGHMGGVYLRAIKATIDSVCDDACALKLNRKCYAQFNAQSTTEAVKMVRDAFAYRIDLQDEIAIPSSATIKRTIADMLDMAGMGDGDFWRSMIVGSAAALPRYVMRAIKRIMDVWKIAALAYVEAWRDRPELKGTHMASCATMDDAREAMALGWRVFLSAPAEDVGNTMPDGFIMCPGSKYHENAGRKRISCTECGLCDGSTDGDKRRSILNIRHGNGDASRVAGLVRRGVLGSLILNGKGRTVGAYVSA